MTVYVWRVEEVATQFAAGTMMLWNRQGWEIFSVTPVNDGSPRVLIVARTIDPGVEQG